MLTKFSLIALLVMLGLLGEAEVDAKTGTPDKCGVNNLFPSFTPS
jgi:hypothetical protein